MVVTNPKWRDAVGLRDTNGNKDVAALSDLCFETRANRLHRERARFDADHPISKFKVLSAIVAIFDANIVNQTAEWVGYAHLGYARLCTEDPRITLGRGLGEPSGALTSSSC